MAGRTFTALFKRFAKYYRFIVMTYFLCPDGAFYLIFDCPGQAELFTHDLSLKRILNNLTRLNVQFVCINLIDANYCTDSSRFISALMLSLNIMINLELPHLNVLSKMDLLESYDRLDFPLSYYMNLPDLTHLMDRLSEKRSQSSIFLDDKYAKFHQAICDMIEDYSLVSFHTLAIEDPESLSKLSTAIDKANGYIFGALEPANESIMQTANTAASIE
jgi:GPN-loop GTPase